MAESSLGRAHKHNKTKGKCSDQLEEAKQGRREFIYYLWNLSTIPFDEGGKLWLFCV